MALAAGSASVNGSGVVSGTGYARTLYDAEYAALGAGFPAAFFIAGVWHADALATIQRLAVKCTAQAVATVALIQTASLRIPADVFDAGMPPSEVVLGGVVE